MGVFVFVFFPARTKEFRIHSKVSFQNQIADVFQDVLKMLQVVCVLGLGFFFLLFACLKAKFRLAPH